MPAQTQSKADVVVNGGGSLFVFEALTETGRTWIAENVSTEGYNPDLPNRVYVEHRYAFDLARGMQQAGLRVK
jgi:hypothetical protein